MKESLLLLCNIEYTFKEAEDSINKHQEYLLTELDNWMDNHTGNWFHFRDHLEDETDCRELLQSYFVIRLLKALKRDEESKGFIINELIDFASLALENNVLFSRHFIDTIIEIKKIPQLRKFYKDISTIWENFYSLVEQLQFRFHRFSPTFIEVCDNDYQDRTSFKEKCVKRLGIDSNSVNSLDSNDCVDTVNTVIKSYLMKNVEMAKSVLL